MTQHWVLHQCSLVCCCSVTVFHVTTQCWVPLLWCCCKHCAFLISCAAPAETLTLQHWVPLLCFLSLWKRNCAFLISCNVGFCNNTVWQLQCDIGFCNNAVWFDVAVSLFVTWQCQETINVVCHRGSSTNYFCLHASSWRLFIIWNFTLFSQEFLSLSHFIFWRICIIFKNVHSNAHCFCWWKPALTNSWEWIWLALPFQQLCHCVWHDNATLLCIAAQFVTAKTKLHISN